MRPAPTDVNLADIAYQFGRGQAQRAKRMIRSMKDSSRKPHNRRDRADFDALINFYCIVTLAAMGGVLELPLPLSFQYEATAELSQPVIWTYMVSQGADLLPRLLMHQIENNNGFVRVLCKDPLQFARFLDVIAIWSESKRRIGHFLRLLDSPSSRGADAKLVRLFVDVKLGKTISNASIEKHFAVLDGFSELLVFSYSYDELLRHLKEFPVFQSAIWHYIAPRFRTSSQRVMDFAEVLAKSIPACSSDPAFEAMLRIVGTKGPYYRPLYEFIDSTETFVGSERHREMLDPLQSGWKTRERLDLNEAIREAVVFARAEAQENRVELRTELADDLPPVRGDRMQLKQVMLTLIMYGIYDMSTVEGTPRWLAIRTKKSEADQVSIVVQDSGVGLDPRSLNRIFDPFFATKPRGIGLGLSICRAILEDHGGSLRALHNDDPGTTFQVLLPSATKT